MAKSKPTTGDVHADMLASMQNPKATHRKRASDARFCLRHRMHRAEAIAVLQEIVNKPDKSIRTKKGLDMARRALIKHGSAAKVRQRMHLPLSWKGLIGSVPEDAVYVSDEDYVKMRKQDRFPDNSSED
jgi:hypothetical protein